MPLSDSDFKYYKRQIEDDIKEHNLKLNELNSPEETIAAYNGKFYSKEIGKIEQDTMNENYLFIAANTVIPSLFFQLPRIQIRSLRSDLAFSAAVLNSLTNATFTEKDKEENQLCIIDAFLPYGYAVMKNGYNSRTGKIQKPNLFTGETKTNKTSDMEGDVEYIKFEKVIGLRQSPKFTYLDHTQAFGKGNRITFQYDRTLQQLIDSNLYNLSTNFINYFSARDTDKRNVKLTIYESWWMEGESCYKLVYTDSWQEELMWIKTGYGELPASYLRFNKMGDILYGIAHGTLGLNAQKELNYLNELWKKHIDNIRNQFLVDENSLTESGKKTLRQNDIGGIITTTKPITGTQAQVLQSAMVDPALFGNIQNVREYLKLIMSTTGGKMGGPESELAITERNKALGDALRSSGMQDEIRSFIVSQIKQRLKNILKLGSPEMILKITGENLINPFTGKSIESNTEIEIGGEKGFELNDIIQGNIDIDYIFDVDITSAARPDYPVIRKQLTEGIAAALPLEPKLNAIGKKINWDSILIDYFSTFDTIPDAKKYISDMTDEDKQKMIANIAAQMPLGRANIPQEEKIAEGAEAVPIGTEGLI